MRIIIIRLLAVTIILVQLSCKKDFLNKTDPTKVNTDLFYKDAKQVEQAVNGVYGTLHAIANDQWITNELPSDNTTIDFNPGDRGQSDRIEAFEFYTVNANSVNLNSSYINYYNSIYNVNNTLAKMQGATGLTDSVKAVNEGQLKFIRAYLYFELTQYYGAVILITKPLDQPSDAWTYQRESSDKVYAQIEADLKDAVGDLPVKYQAGHVGRATKGAALSLLGKVYLTEKKYADAATTLSQVLPLGYDLNVDYADAFNPQKKNGIESIFEIQYQGGNDLGEWSSFIYTFAPRLSAGAVTGWPQSNPGGWNIPTNDIIDAYEPGDTRKDASVGLDFKSPVTNQTVPYIKKYDHVHAIYGRTDDNWPVLRYSDVLLMLAEAMNENGKTAQSLPYLNQVRQRVGLPGYTGLTKDEAREKIYLERRFELTLEGHRWFDLVRTGRALATLQKLGMKENMTVFPLPLTQIQIINDPAILPQNPGYN